MVISDSKIMVKNRAGEIQVVKINEVLKSLKTFQVLSMNARGHERYTFSLIDNILTETTKEETTFYVITVKNELEIERKICCSINTQLFATTTNWSGFVSPNKLKKNHLIIDEEDRLNKLVSIERINVPAGTVSYNIRTAYNNNYFCNGILIR